MVSISGGNNDFSQTSLPHKTMTVRNQVRKLGFLEQVWLLLWKSSLQRRRSLLGTLSELLSPLIGAIIVFSIRQVSCFPTDKTNITIFQLRNGEV